MNHAAFFVSLMRQLYSRDRLKAEFGAEFWKCLAGGPGFEPRLTESESAVLPLNYPPTAPRQPSATTSSMALYFVAADFSLESGRILTRTLAGLAAALTISPVAGLRTKVPAFRAGTLRRVAFRRPGRVNSPTPRG